MKNHPTRWGGVIGPASPVAWGAHRWARPNPLSQGQAQPLSLWSPPAAGVLCLCHTHRVLCHTRRVLCLCRLAPVEGAAGAAEAAPDRLPVLVPPLQQSSPTVLSPPDKCPSGSVPRPPRQRRLKFVSSEPPLVSVGHSLRFLTCTLVHKSHNAQQFAHGTTTLSPPNDVIGFGIERCAMRSPGSAVGKADFRREICFLPRLARSILWVSTLRTTRNWR